MHEVLLQKTLSDLEWEKIESEVEKRLRGPHGLHFRLPLAHTKDGSEQSLRETAEALGLWNRGEPLPLDGIRDVSQHLLRVERHGDLDVTAVNDVRLTLRAARTLRRFLGARKHLAPALSAACPIDPSLDRLSDTLDSALDNEGTLADYASAELRRLRTETRNLRASLISRLEELMHKQAELLSDRFYTLRDGRYVLPVRADAHERVHGIVHGASASGSTIFVEPRSLVLSGNRLKLAEAEQEREETRILALLSEEIRQTLPSIGAAFEALLHADLKNASAMLARDFKWTEPLLVDEPEIHLRDAKHPVLQLDGVEVVANDVDAFGGKALVISGPNAGGKTVALKLLGLAALMVRAGLFVPAAEGARCGYFSEVLSDIGDEQSLSKNLSTFSAHIDHIKRILEVSGSSSLVLLDELAGSTDPEEGAALACAVVERLCELGAAVAVTTHYEPLKARALSDARMRNASVGFDVARMLPTFRLRLDAPGASSALAVAERFGLPRVVIERAKSIVPEQSKQFDALVRALETKLHATDVDAQRLSEELTRATQIRSALEADLERQKAREKKALGEEAQRVLEELRGLRGDIDRAKKSLKQEKLADAQVRETARRADELAQLARRNEAVKGVVAGEGDDAHAGGAIETEALAVGKRVYVPRLRAEAEIVEAPTRGRVRVAAGAMRLWVDLADVRPSGKGDEARAPVKPSRLAAPGRPTARSSENSLDIKGMRVDDALSLLDAFLDRMYGQDERVAYIEHGYGTGALKDAVREHLGRLSQYVESMRPGGPDEGGERLTVVTLR